MIVSVPLWAEVVYVAGRVNGEVVVWTRGAGCDWFAVAALSDDGMYTVDIEAYDALGRVTPFLASLYFSQGLTWKVNWRATDDWARDGVRDCARLWFNYESLRDELNADFGFDVAFNVPPLDGYATEAGSGLLNGIEAAMNALRVFLVPWNDKAALWLPGGAAPTFEDVNRWESNGREIEFVMRRVRSSWVYSGEAWAESGQETYF